MRDVRCPRLVGRGAEYAAVDAYLTRPAPGPTRSMISKYDWPLLAPGKKE